MTPAVPTHRLTIDLNWLLQYDNLKLWMENNKYCVKFLNCRVKQKFFYFDDIYGRGETVFAACRNYREQLVGKTLLFDYGSYKQEINIKE